MNTNTLILIALCIFSAGLVACGIIFVINCTNYLKNKLRISEFDITSHLTIDSTLSDKLDAFIESNLHEYIILNFPPTKDNEYISPEKEEEIRKGLAAFISSRISEIFMQQLSTYYNSESLNEVIATKIYIAVTNFVINNNQTQSTNVFRPNLPDYTDMSNSAKVTNIFYDPSTNF